MKQTEIINGKIVEGLGITNTKSTSTPVDRYDDIRHVDMSNDLICDMEGMMNISRRKDKPAIVMHEKYHDYNDEWAPSKRMN